MPESKNWKLISVQGRQSPWGYRVRKVPRFMTSGWFRNFFWTYSVENNWIRAPILTGPLLMAKVIWARKTSSAWSRKLKSTHSKMRSSRIRYFQRIPLNPSAWNQLLELKTFKARLKAMTKRTFLTNVMKSSTGLIRVRLQRKNLKINRESWKKTSATHLYQAMPECSWQVRRNTWRLPWWTSEEDA